MYQIHKKLNVKASDFKAKCIFIKKMLVTNEKKELSSEEHAN